MRRWRMLFRPVRHGPVALNGTCEMDRIRGSILRNWRTFHRMRRVRRDVWRRAVGMFYPHLQRNVNFAAAGKG